MDQFERTFEAMFLAAVTVVLYYLFAGEIGKKIWSFRYRRHVKRVGKKHADKLKNCRAVIRQYREGDEASVLALLREQAAAAGDSFDANEVREVLGAPNLRGVLLLAQVENRIVGYATLQRTLHGLSLIAARLADLYVLPDFRNEGIGSTLVANVLQEARLSGHDVVQSDFAEGDATAAGFLDMTGALRSPRHHVMLLTPPVDAVDAESGFAGETSPHSDPPESNPTLH